MDSDFQKYQALSCDPCHGGGGRGGGTQGGKGGGGKGAFELIKLCILYFVMTMTLYIEYLVFYVVFYSLFIMILTL